MQRSDPTSKRRSNLRLAILLALVALGIYAVFIFLNIPGGEQ